ncbi:LytTR family DNA-binding domain-containing protein [uncultured Alistipes sp.]|uniref:LytR/AlgR family response regulator transcription factor n=1 Tax=uncultured Alistipes sp. TaxID=538949 RepID=UPI0025E8586D|nr:LytTR family DNA-binding domain-containing protein [uncultured Alistipes sp.]
MKVLIVEDEIMAQANMVRALTQNYPDMQIIGTAASVKEAVGWLRTPENKADVIFMDVELSDGTCFEIFRQVDVTARVIMTTAYDSYAVKAFEVNSIDYLLKPIDPAALRRAVERCRARSGRIDADLLLNALQSGGQREYKQRHIVRFNDRIVPVKTCDIAYFYSEDKNTYLVTNDDVKYIMDLSLDILTEELDTQCFFRISRNCIIAMTAIVSIVKALGNRLKIIAKPRPAFEMMVSRSRVEDFLKWLEGEK